MPFPPHDTPDPRCVPEWEVTPRQVQIMQREGSPMFLVDCRRPDEHEFARIADSTLIPMNDLSVHVEDLARREEDGPVVIYCHTGRRSLHVAHALREIGLEDVWSMAGGIHRWSEEIDSTVPTY